MAKILLDIERKGATGLVKFKEDGIVRAARFDRNWTDKRVLDFFGIETPKPQKEKDHDKA